RASQWARARAWYAAPPVRACSAGRRERCGRPLAGRRSLVSVRSGRRRPSLRVAEYVVQVPDAGADVGRRDPLVVAVDAPLGIAALHLERVEAVGHDA